MAKIENELHIRPELRGKKVEKFGQWVSVEDALPNQYEDVLAYDECAGQMVSYLNRKDEWGGCQELHNVTFWMPLPEPPELEDEEYD